MSEKSFVYDNTYARKINGLYLQSEMSDVSFVFDADTDHPEKVPAHKIILSLDNAVFKAMFYGLVKEEGDVPIEDTRAAAFKEFLQFFYLDQVRLTSKNIGQVINLCKMYGMDECMEICEAAFQESLTIDDMCFGYNYALLLENKNSIEFCKQKIIRNAREIIKSESFLEGERNLVEKILDLVSSYWSAVETVVACMEWAKAECNRHSLDTSPKNLRNQLESLFSRIPFEKLTLEQFSQYFITYNGFFDGDEIARLSQTIFQNQQSKSFDLQLLSDTTIPTHNILVCNRWEPGTFEHTWNAFKSSVSLTSFSSNKKLLLIKFYIPDFVSGSQVLFFMKRRFPVFDAEKIYNNMSTLCNTM